MGEKTFRELLAKRRCIAVTCSVSSWKKKKFANNELCNICLSDLARRSIATNVTKRRVDSEKKQQLRDISFPAVHFRWLRR